MALILLFLLFLPLISLLFLLPTKLLRKDGSEQAQYPPGPPGLPFIGNLHQLDASNFARQLCLLSKKYGPIMSLRLGFRPALVISSPRMAKEVMKTHDLAFCSRPTLLGFKKLSYNGSDVVLSPYNEYWREMRKIVTLHLFSNNKVHSFRPIREDEVFQMIKGISESSKIINLTETMMTLANTIICRVAFGKKFDQVYKKRFQGLLEECQVVMAKFYFSDHFPLMGWLDKFTGSIARLERIYRDMDLFYQELIDEHLSPDRPSSMHGDVIDILLQFKGDAQQSSIDFTFDNIKAILMNIFIAGTETTAGTINWIMTCLIKNPRVMKKAQEEVRQLIGKKERIDEEDLQNIELPYLKAVIKEGLRLHPIAPLLITRETLEKSVIHGYEIEAKTIVYVNAWAIGRDPAVWEDAEEFLPDRFLDTPIDFKGQHFELIPFGAGRRICPGMHMGVTTMELVLSNLLYLFEWELPAGINKEDVASNLLLIIGIIIIYLSHNLQFAYSIY